MPRFSLALRLLTLGPTATLLLAWLLSGWRCIGIYCFVGDVVITGGDLWLEW